MKRLFLLYTIVFSINLVLVIGVVRYVNNSKVVNEELLAYYNYSGFKKNFSESPSPNLDPLNQYANSNVALLLEDKPKFNYFSSIMSNNSNYIAVTQSPFLNSNFEKLAYYSETDLSNIRVDSDMVYKNTFKELPLYAVDYYYNKYTNAVAGVRQLNTMPIMTPGTSIGIIRNLYLVIIPKYGYVRPPHYVYGSGVCWTTSTLGAMMDDANVAFKKKYGVDLFIYRSGDRAPHGGFYPTYTNGQHGYTILQSGIGNPAQDYRINVNPAISRIPGLSDLKIKFVLLNSSKHPKGAYGESIAAYLISNKEF
jgi:hypothetical protein